MRVSDWGPPTPGTLRVGGAPPGHDAAVLAELAARSRGPVLHVLRDDRRLAETAEALNFRAPQLPVLEFSAWDCQPYDRVSPSPDVSARRVLTLTRLAEGPPESAVVLTTVNAVLQRIPPRARMRDARWSARVGDAAELEALARTLDRNGYRRVPAVALAGEFAVRGGLLDVFGPGMTLPLRLEFAFDQLESIRAFRPVDQRTTGDAQGSVALVLASETPLDPDSVARFRRCYLEEFGIPHAPDPGYEAIASGQRYPGMEHWLPFFHQRLETLFDYLPKAPVVLDELVENSVAERLQTVAAAFDARMAWAEEGEGTTYRPCRPAALYLDADEWQHRLRGRAVRQLVAGRVPPGDAVLDAGARAGWNLADDRVERGGDLFGALAHQLLALREAGKSVLVAAASAGARDRIGLMLAEAGCALAPVRNWPEFETAMEAGDAPAMLAIWQVTSGYETKNYAVIAEADVFGERLASRRADRPSGAHLRNFATLSPGELVVHAEFGLGRFQGLETIGISGAHRECATLEYAGGDVLRVPVENIDLLYRYGESERAQLDRLGAAGWQARQARARQRVKEIAAQLLRTAAARALRSAPAFDPPEDLYAAFCARFPYTETEGQTEAMSETLTDLAAGRPMDRLVCGDVGFGKTEVALRAAFVVAMAGGQVAILAPTTLLARQHYRNFRERFHGFPVEVRQLTRFTGSADAVRVREGLKSGEVSIVIGTHALLARSTEFAQLRLAIIDEEQQFGVEQKEKLKALRADMHVLAMSATPIPRTLQMALGGVRPMSLIATPPADRLSVRAYTMPFDPVSVRAALMREQAREGQSFMVVPRILDLEPSGAFLRNTVPEVRFAIAHGQLPRDLLQERMNAFYDGAYDVLLSTSIIASGLDIPRANTMIVRRADMFGLAQLYQIRGRVGRSRARAYVYFTTDPRRRLSEAAGRRLEAVAAMEELGAGFALASRDLDIRGAGNLLGAEQAGHIREVGAELYQEMLEKAVYQLRAEESDGEIEEPWSPRIELGLSAAIPDSYIPDLATRLGLYRRLAELRDETAVEGIAAEIRDRFGRPPAAVETLYRILHLKVVCRQVGIATIDMGKSGMRVTFRPGAVASPARLVNHVARNPGMLRLRPDGTLVVRGTFGAEDDRAVQALTICRGIGAVVRSGSEREAIDGAG